MRSTVRFLPIDGSARFLCTLVLQVSTKRLLQVLSRRRRLLDRSFNCSGQLPEGLPRQACSRGPTAGPQCGQRPPGALRGPRQRPSGAGEQRGTHEGKNIRRTFVGAHSVLSLGAKVNINKHPGSIVNIYEQGGRQEY